MRSKPLSFFQPCNGINPLDDITKTIDGLMAYNQSLIKQLKSATFEEGAEIIFAMYFNDKTTPKLNPSFERFYELLKPQLIQQISTDLDNYEKIKLQLEQGNVDYLYLSMFIIHKKAVQELKLSVNANKFETLVRYFFPAGQTKRKSKEITASINQEKNNIQVMVEYNIIAGMIASLKKMISPACQKYLDVAEIVYVGSMGGVKIDDYEFNKIMRKSKSLQEQSSQNEMLHALIQQYSAAVEERPSSRGIEFHDQFLALFDKMAKIYKIEEQIDQLMPKSKTENNTSVTAKPTKQAKKKHIPSPEKKICSPKQISSKEPLKSEIAIQPSTEIDLEKKYISEIKDTPLAVIESGAVISELVLLEEIIPYKTISIETEHTVTATEVQEEIDETLYTYQPYQKKKEERPTLPIKQDNTLHLNKDEQELFLKVFHFNDDGSNKNDSISLRSLVNLTTQRFGGVIEKTGANRCRIKMQNIYAFISAPEERLSQICNSATVTMHGGGHRSSPSQNNDRGTAPNYLIEQFKDAFIRAGFTPANLGLDLPIETETYVVKI